MMNMQVKPVIAELLGTFLLGLTVASIAWGGRNIVAANGYLYAPAIIGGIVGLLVYVLGSVSGAQFNPAVTLGLWAVKKLESIQALAYVVAQLIGAVLGLRLGAYLLDVKDVIELVRPETMNGNQFFGELLGAFILTFVVTKVAMGRVHAAAGGLAIGAALMLAITLASLHSAGVLNPAISIAFGKTAFTDMAWLLYVVGPLLGGVIGSFAAKLLDTDEK